MPQKQTLQFLLSASIKLFNFVKLFKVQLCPLLYISSICVVDFSILSIVQFCQTWEFKLELRSENFEIVEKSRF